MNNMWFAASELTFMAGLPSSPRGVNQMARREGWINRRRAGVQSKALEYHINSLPPWAHHPLLLQEASPAYKIERQDPLDV